MASSECIGSQSLAAFRGTQSSPDVKVDGVPDKVGGRIAAAYVDSPFMFAARGKVLIIGRTKIVAARTFAPGNAVHGRVGDGRLLGAGVKAPYPKGVVPERRVRLQRTFEGLTSQRRFDFANRSAPGIAKV